MRVPLGIPLLLIGLLATGAPLSRSESSASTAQIRIRALDYKTGRPLKGHRIAIWLSDSTGQIQYHESEKLIRSTDKDGRAIFEIKEPLPPQVMVDTDSLPDWNCSATWQLTTSEILQRGIVGQYTSDPKCRKKASPPAASPVPGEVVIYVRQLGVLGRLHRLFY